MITRHRYTVETRRLKHGEVPHNGLAGIQEAIMHLTPVTQHKVPINIWSAA